MWSPANTCNNTYLYDKNSITATLSATIPNTGRKNKNILSVSEVKRRMKRILF